MLNNKGDWVVEEEEIAKVAANYFRGIFQSGNNNLSEIRASLDGLSPKITAAQNRELMRPFLSVDIEAALKDMRPTKASGCDGLQVLFFQ